VKPERAGALVDVHAHFLHEASGRSDWAERNRSRLAAGSRIGITLHVASILGSWGRRSPIYFPSPEDVTSGNEALRAIVREHPGLVAGYVAVNPNYTRHAIAEIERGLAAGMVGVKLAASRRARDPLLDPIAALAGERGVPVLQHAWQHRRREVSNQEISDALDLLDLAGRHDGCHFILAHIGGGGEWAHSLRALRGVTNVWVDLSGSGVDRGMLELCLECVGPERLLWGSDLTMDTGWAKLRALEAMGLADQALEGIRWRTAARLFKLSL
jgi:predicted TIM-barrel fold metal-dependent hydrolase